METERGAAAELPLWRRIPMVFYAPARLGAALRERPVWFWAFALGLPVSILGPALIPDSVWMAGRPSGGRESGFAAFGAGMDAFVDVAATGIVWVLWAVAFPVIATLALKLLGGGTTRYRHVLSSTVHAMWIVAIGGLVLLPLRIATGDPYFSLSLGTALGWGFDPWYAGVAHLVDLFAVWFALATATMLAERSEGPGRGVASLVTLVVTVLIVGAMSYWNRG